MSLLFTIAIPTYNNGGSLTDAIDSAINQSYGEDYEVLVIDNNSTDNTTEILLGFLGKITFKRNESTVSMYDNHNICLKEAIGDYIIFCHADDQLLPSALNDLESLIRKRGFPDKYVAWGRSVFRDFYSNLKPFNLELNVTLQEPCALLPFLRGGLTPSGSCYSKLSFLKLGGFMTVDHRLAPSDSITMWRLVLNEFYCEMTTRSYFKREKASTATNITPFISRELSDLTLKSFLSSVSEKEKLKFSQIVNRYDTSSAIYMTISLVEMNILKRSLVIKRILLNLLRSRSILRTKELLYLLSIALKVRVKSFN